MNYLPGQANNGHHSDSWDDDESIFSGKGKEIGRGRGKCQTKLHNNDDNNDTDDHNSSDHKPHNIVINTSVTMA